MPRARLAARIDTDLLLLFPPCSRRVVSMESIGVGSIAAAARAAGFRCALLNAGLHGLDTRAVGEIVRRARFDVLAVSTLHWTMPAALEIARHARRHHPDCHIVFGGLEAALDTRRVLLDHPWVDSIGLGEGEPTVTALLAARAGGRDWRTAPGLAWREGDTVRRSPLPPLIDPLDALPFPARDDLPAVLEAGGPVSLSSSRGCPGRCTFCSVRAFYGRAPGHAWRGRSPASLVAEMQEIVARHGARLFSFIDETTVGPGTAGPARLAELAAQIRRARLAAQFFMAMRADQVEEALLRDLRAAGLRKVELGIESMAPTQLRRFAKATRVADNRRAIAVLERLGIAAELFLIPFDPGVTRHELETNLRFCRARCQSGRGYDVLPLSLGNYLYPYPGTGTHALYERRGWLAAAPPHPLRTADPRLRRVGDALRLLVEAVEPAFPMSYLGLGNLWVNSAGLPAPVYGRVGDLCTETGRLLVDFADWALAVAARPRPIPIGDIQGLITELRRFLARLTPLRADLRVIARRHGHRGARADTPAPEASFARDLLLAGRRRKRRLIRQALAGAPDEHAVITGILDALTRDVG